MAGTYTIMVNRSTVFWESGGAGTYRFLIGTQQDMMHHSYVGHSDAGTGTDAGTDMTNAIPLDQTHR